MRLYDMILDSIEMLIDSKIKKLELTSIFTAKIKCVNEDETYKIEWCGKEYNVENGLGISLRKNQFVRVVIPNGDMNDMFICAIKN